MRAIKKAYKIIFGKESDIEKADWQIADELMNKFIVRDLGDDLAKECLFEIILHIPFPSTETTHRIVGKAENIAEELFEELAGHDAHMATIEALEWKYWKDKEKEKKEEGDEIKGGTR